MNDNAATFATEFGKLKPELVADFEGYIVRNFDRLVAKYGDDMVKTLGRYVRFNERVAYDLAADMETYKKVLRRFMTGDALNKRTGPALSRDYLTQQAEQYADDQIAAFVFKLTKKLGEVRDVVIQRVDAHGFECNITGTMHGRSIRVNQSRKFVVNQQGTAFHQWPALIYVDGKFTTESKFKALTA